MLKVEDKVYCKKNILRGLGTVIALSSTGKTAKVKWPDPYNRGIKPAYYKFKNLLDKNA